MTSFQPESFLMNDTAQLSVLSRLNAMREESLLTDFVIRASVDGRSREFQAHRCVLASNDGFFGALLAGAGSSMREAEVRSIDLDEDPDLMEMVVEFLYGGQVSIEFERVMDLLAMAVRLQVRGLAEQCTDTLRRHVNERNCVELFKASATHGCNELKVAARDAVVAWLPTLLRHANNQFRGGTSGGNCHVSTSASALASTKDGQGSSNAPPSSSRATTSERANRRAARRTAERDATLSRTPSVVAPPQQQIFNQSDGFLTLPASLVVEILESDRLACDEGVIFYAAATWVEARLQQYSTAVPIRRRSKRVTGEKRRRTIAVAESLADDEDCEEAACDDVLRRVRYPIMDATFLADVVKPHPVMQTPTRKALVAEAFEHLALRAAGRERGGVSETRDDDDDGGDDQPLLSRDSFYTLADRIRRREAQAAARVWPPRFDVGRILNEGVEGGHTDAVAALCVCAGRIVSGSWDSTVRVWDPETGSCECVLQDHVGTVRALAEVAGKLVSAAEDGTIRVWDPARLWERVQVLGDHSNDTVNAVVAIPDESEEGEIRFASGGDAGEIKIWSKLHNTEWRCQLTLHGVAHVGVLVLASTDNFLVSGGDDARIRVWNTRTWMLERTLHDHEDEVWALAIVGENLVSGSVDHSIKVWSMRNDWECEKTVVGHDGPVYALANLQNHLVSGSSDETIQAWSHDWEREANDGTNCSGVWCLTVHNDRLVTGGVNGVIRIWDHR